MSNANHSLSEYTQLLTVVGSTEWQIVDREDIYSLFHEYGQLNIYAEPFSGPPALQSTINSLNTEQLPTEISDAFTDAGIVLSQDVTVSTRVASTLWTISDPNHVYTIRKESSTLKIYPLIANAGTAQTSQVNALDGVNPGLPSQITDAAPNGISISNVAGIGRELGDGVESYGWT